MGRRSHNDPIMLHARLPVGEAGWWGVIKRLDEAGPWSTADVHGETNTPRGPVCAFVAKLRKAGIAKLIKVERTRHGRPKNLYRLARRPNDVPRLRGDGSPSEPRAQEALWRTIRTLKTFGLRELAFLATSGRKAVPLSTARWYCRKLLGAGYLVEVPRSVRTIGYRLKPGMDTGPKAPVVLQVQSVWDPNLQRSMGEAIAKEVA